MRDARSVVSAAAKAVRERIATLEPRAAVVLGSGLGFLADDVADAVRIPYREIPGFPAVGVVGHRGELVAGTLEGVPVIAQSGRFHLYEGHAPATVALPVRVFAELGVATLIATNAAGGIRATFRPGTLMLIADHINLMWRSPLSGGTLPGEQRFPDMSEPYDRALRARARELAVAHRIALEEGVYCGLLGPSYETPAEIRLYQRLGADAVGMSTVPEVIVARARGLRCMGFSTITNVASGLSPHKLSHDEVLDVGRRVASQLGTLVKGIVAML